jgi:hypothetical protein
MALVYHVSETIIVTPFKALNRARAHLLKDRKGKGYTAGSI